MMGNRVGLQGQSPNHFKASNRRIFSGCVSLGGPRPSSFGDVVPGRGEGAGGKSAAGATAAGLVQAGGLFAAVVTAAVLSRVGLRAQL